MGSRAGFLAVAIVAAFLAGRASVNVTLPFPLPIPNIVDDAPPVPGDVRNVLVIYETDDRVSMPAEQRAIIDSVPLRAWIKDQRFESRFLDPQTELRSLDEWWGQALQLDRESLPWVVISNGRTGYSGPLPKDVEEFKQLLGRYVQ